MALLCNGWGNEMKLCTFIKLVIFLLADALVFQEYAHLKKKILLAKSHVPR